jgi:lysophospholipase L1-like esterase
MAEDDRNTESKNLERKTDLGKMQKRYLIGGLLFGPLLPLLYLQGQFVRLKVGRLPDAGGDNVGITGEGEETFNLLAIGESTIAGIGAETHREAFTGQFAKHFSQKMEKKVKWHAFGVSGITVRRTIQEVVPHIPDEQMNLIVIALGANDVFAVNSPKKWRRDISELINLLKEKYPDTEIFLANVPMIRDFLALPNPLRYLLSRLAKIQHFNTIDLISTLEKVYYFEEVSKVDDEFFCADGVHPSVKGYDLWSEAMVESYLQKKSE